MGCDSSSEAILDSSRIKAKQYTREETKKIQNVISYARSIVGCKYRYYIPGEKTLVDQGPFWSVNLPAPHPEIVKKSNSVCIGLINLLRRKANQPVPGAKQNQEYAAGGTIIWTKFLKQSDKLQTLDVGVSYPIGTMLVRLYGSEQDPGHFAVIADIGKNVLCQEIVHSYCHDWSRGDFRQKQPGITDGQKMVVSHYGWSEKKGYYNYIVRPQNWILSQ